jgi:hypothetical protein
MSYNRSAARILAQPGLHRCSMLPTLARQGGRNSGPKVTGDN